MNNPRLEAIRLAKKSQEALKLGLHMTVGDWELMQQDVKIAEEEGGFIPPVKEVSIEEMKSVFPGMKDEIDGMVTPELSDEARQKIAKRIADLEKRADKLGGDE